MKDSIVYIHEPTPLQCGQAVLAMVSGKSVEEIIKLTGTDRETDLKQMKSAFSELGFSLSESKNSFTDAGDLPKAALLSLETPRCWHWSLYYNGTFYDPEHGVSEVLTGCDRRYFWEITDKLQKNNRKSGVLMPVFSLPSPYGIGTFGKAAFDFIDFLSAAGQSIWQILPLGPTSYGDSPYQSFSSAAGNPYFIDLDLLSEDSLLKKEDYAGIDFGTDPNAVDYEKLYNGRYKVLRTAYSRFIPDADFNEFCSSNAGWLYPYVCFAALKEKNGGKCWYEWESAEREYSEELKSTVLKSMPGETGFHCFLQYEFYKQWQAVKVYAAKKGISILGDLPIYVSLDSADVWANTRFFKLDEKYRPTCVAGCPPDAFCKDGQLWGNPLYNWDELEKDGFAFWTERVKRVLVLYDTVRIDHFRGFESYYSIPFGDKDARRGVWEKGPGMKLFRALKKELGTLPLVAEDLGHLTPAVGKLLKDSGFPGMKVLQFAFDGNSDSDYLPHNHVKNCVVYTGTHDNDTVVGWAKTLSAADFKFADEYLPNKGDAVNWRMIRACLSSVADTAIITVQDLIGAGSEARINTPSTFGGNWQWRVSEGCTNPWLAGILYDLTNIYRRVK